jgi:hypothetical protein
MQKTGEEARFICAKLLEGADKSAIIFSQNGWPSYSAFWQ